MPHYIDVFIAPVRDNPVAQTLTVGLMALAALDVLMGVANAWFVQHDFQSHELREGVVRKLANMGLLVMAMILDGLLLGGLDLGFQPLYVAVASLLALMEVASLLEIFAQTHPELADSEIYRMLGRGKEVENGYRAHVQTAGWLPAVYDGQVAGSVGYSKRLEALKMCPPEGVTLDAMAHVQTHGDLWFRGIRAGEYRGTKGESRRVEAVRMWVA